VLESRRTVTQGDQGQEQRRTFAQVLESRRTVIQGDLNKGEEGLSSRDQVQRRKVQVVQQGEENPAARNRRTDFWGADLRYHLRYQRTDLADLRYQRMDRSSADLRYQRKI
jgi:hypothetical protein